MRKKSIIIALVVLTTFSLIASGQMLSYLSNSSQAKANVEGPPLKLEYNDAGTWRECSANPLDLGTMYGTDVASWEYKVTKLAHSESDNSDIQIQGTLRGELYCPLGISIDEISEVTVSANCPAIGYSEVFEYTNDGDSGNDDFTPTDLGNKLRFEHDTLVLYKQWGYKGEITITFSPYAYGEYTATLQIL